MIRRGVRAVKERIKEKVSEAAERVLSVPTTALQRTDRSSTSLQPETELPVVARLVVEIRSDGSRTVARGAMEDIATGERIAVQAEGTTPLQLAGSLAKTLLSVPALALQAARALADASKDDKSRR
jgi:hypothetical protein